MATWYLLNTINYAAAGGAVLKLRSGRLVDDTVLSAATIAGVGGILWPSSDPAVAAVAPFVQALQQQAGADENQCDKIMLAAALGSARNGAGNAALVQCMTVAIPLSQIVTETSGTAFNVGAALPTNARVVGAEILVGTALSGDGETGVLATLQAGTDAAGSMIASTSVFTGGKPVIATPGSDPYASRGGQQVKMTLTTTTNPLADLTAGALTVRVYYLVMP